MRILKLILKWGAIALLVLIVGFYAVSEYLLRSAPEAELYALNIPTDAASIGEGEQLARTRGCQGCHGESLAGQAVFDEPIFARVVAPNLTTLAQTESAEVLEKAIRQGIGRDGDPLVLMPSAMYHYLTDEDTAKIIAYLKSLPVVENDLPDNFFGPISRMFFIKQEFETAAALVAKAPPPQYQSNQNSAMARGEYLALTMCTECHGPDLSGTAEGGFVTPDLSIVLAYDAESFSHLMKTGEAIGGRELDLMAEVAVGRTAYLKDAEVQSLYHYLKGRTE